MWERDLVTPPAEMNLFGDQGIGLDKGGISDGIRVCPCRC
jgi:hypothetical protein